jgi:hypothetical protein
VILWCERMPLHPHLGHWIGVAGETLNFFGAVVLGLDLFFNREKLTRLGEWGRKYNVPGSSKGVAIKDPKFAEKVKALRAAHLGYWGTGLLALGFLLLVSHHLIAIYSE